MVANFTYSQRGIPPDDRRRFQRVRSGLPVEFRRLSEPGHRLAGSLSRDLSAGGIRLTTTRFLPRDTRMVVLFTPPGMGRQLRAVARVGWTRERPLGESFDSGLEFVEISSQDRDAISGLVERGAVLT